MLKQIFVFSGVLILAAGCHGPEARMSGVGPKLTSGADGRLILSYIDNSDTTAKLLYREFRDGMFGPSQQVASGTNWFINWADFPSVLALSDDRMVAHWLVRQPAGGYAYDVTLAISNDGGSSWSSPFLAHDDDTPTEHGFVTLFPDGQHVGAVWLDGRHMEGSHDAGGHGGMTLRAANITAEGTIKNGTEVDSLTCDCCQTDVAVTENGPVVIYRDRTDGEIRDIYVARRLGGQWLPGTRVAADDWQIAGCPVNGPVLDTAGDALVATWFSAAQQKPRVQTAWSTDGGAKFEAPITVASDDVAGYVGQAPVAADAVVVSWLCGTQEGILDICYRRVQQEGALGPIFQVDTAGAVRRMSVPQLAAHDGKLVFVWTDRKDGDTYVDYTVLGIPPVAPVS